MASRGGSAQLSSSAPATLPERLMEAAAAPMAAVLKNERREIMARILLNACAIG